MSKSIDRLNNIVRKINFIENIVVSKNGIISALSDEENSRASIMMHLTSIAEQFDKLSKDGEFEILSKFDKNDLKGSYDIRNYIVHDYEGLNLMVIEVVIREKLPKIKEVALNILDNNYLKESDEF
jgi:uncharacterized protein with HEPN domain